MCTVVRQFATLVLLCLAGQCPAAVPRTALRQAPNTSCSTPESSIARRGLSCGWGESKRMHNPLFGEDKPWEVRYDNLGPSVVFDEEKGLYRFWYVPFIVDPTTSTATDDIRRRMTYCQKMTHDNAIGNRKMAICYARSRDGIVWEKPAMGLCKFEGSTTNNIVMNQENGALGGVYKDRRETDPARRYKMFAGTSVGFSPDGIHWSEAMRLPTDRRGC